MDSLSYAGVVNPVDGVMYPGINAELPEELVQQISAQLRYSCGMTKLNTIFARLSLHGVEPPHWAHNDASMGKYTMILYMTQSDYCRGGTALVSYLEDELSLEQWEKDTHKRELWNIDYVCEMVPNRAFVFPSHLMHAAMPKSGFGTSPIDGRLIIGAFFE